MEKSGISYQDRDVTKTHSWLLCQHLLANSVLFEARALDPSWFQSEPGRYLKTFTLNLVGCTVLPRPKNSIVPSTLAIFYNFDKLGSLELCNLV